MNNPDITDVSYTLRSAANGYILERGWKEVRTDKEFDYSWKESKNIFLTYDDAIDFMKQNII